MKFIDYIRTSLKNMFRQKLRTFLTILAITVGSLSIILMFSIIIGIRQSLVDSFKHMGAFNLVTVSRDPNSADSDNANLLNNGNTGVDDEGKKIDDATLTLIKRIPNVIDATPTLAPWTKTIHLEGQDKKLWSNIMAYQPESNVLNLPLLAGRNLTSSDMDKIVVGTRFLETYGYMGKPDQIIGKKVALNMEFGPNDGPDWGPQPPKPNWSNSDKKEDNGGRKVEIQAEIVGVADNRNMSDDQNYINIAWAKKLMTIVNWEYDDVGRQDCEKRFEQQSQEAKKNGQPFNGQSNCDKSGTFVLRQNQFDNRLQKEGYGSIIVKVDKVENVQKVAEEIQKIGYGATTAENMINQMNKIFGMISALLAVIGGISLFVAAIGIINTMVMAGYERIKEIGVMRACGATKRVIRLLFTLEAAMLGFWGGIFGFLICLGLGAIVKILINKFGAILGNIPVDHLGEFPIWLILAVVGFTTFVGLISGLYPAIRAARLNPVDALRYE
jgi:putative ABC transport system permease protein